MSFIYPFFLFALIALAIPVIIHFFNFKRYKTVYFSNVSLLKLIRQESRKKSVLKQLFILISRLLAIAALVFAFSRPYVPLNNRKTNAARETVAIFIDNTFSMKAEGEKGQLLEQAKSKAIEIANSYQVGTQFIILTSDFLPQHQFPFNKDQFIQQVSEIKESPRSAKLSEIYKQAVTAVSNPSKKTEKTIYILSDFQKNSMDFDELKSDSSFFTYLMDFEAGKTNNLIIDSCWFDVPGRKIGQQEKLFVRIKNSSGQAFQNIPVRLTINDSLKAIANINISEEEETTIELNYSNNSAGMQLCKIELDDYPILYDNSFYMSYQVKNKLNALGIYNPKSNGSEFLKALFADDDLINYNETPENNIQISQLKNNDCIFLINNQKISSGLKNELLNWTGEGGSLVIFPEKLDNYDEYNALLNSMDAQTITAFDTIKTGISEINYTNEIYREVFKKLEKEADLPHISGSVRFSDTGLKSETSLLKFRNGRNALTAKNYENGKVYLFAFPLKTQNINFIRHQIFVPTVYNMALYSGGTMKYAYSIGKDESIVLNQNQDISGELKIRNLQTNDEFLLPARTIGTGQKILNLNDLPEVAGHYLILNDEQPVQPLSFNYSRQESVPEFYSPEELKTILQAYSFKNFQLIESTEMSFSETLQDLNNGKQLWKHFIILAFIFLLCEIAIIRFWK
ncbi:MAG: BatA domain-containing protein [Prolixibacteraceae bacterium]